jgi:hypothetical protein
MRWKVCALVFLMLHHFEETTSVGGRGCSELFLHSRLVREATSRDLSTHAESVVPESSWRPSILRLRGGDTELTQDEDSEETSGERRGVSARE